MLFRPLLAALLCSSALLAESAPLHTGQADPWFKQPLQWEAHLEERWLPVAVPGYWQGSLPVPATGNLTYRLKFSLTPGMSFNALAADEINSAAIIALNGVTLCRSGRPGQDRQSEFARLYPVICAFDPALLTEENELILKISNFHARGGGILSIRLGDKQELEYELSRHVLKEGALLGITFLAGIVFLILFFARPAQKAYLLFGLITIFINLRLISSNGFLELIWHENDWTDLRLYIEYATAICLLPSLFIWYFHFLLPPPAASRSWQSLFLNSLHRLMLWYFTAGPCALLIAISAIYDASIYGQYQPWMVLLILLPCAAYLLLYQIWCSVSGNRSGWITLSGYFALALAVFHDSFYTIQGISINLLVPTGMLFYSIALCVVMGLSVRKLGRDLLQSFYDLEEKNITLKDQDLVKDAFIKEAAAGIVTSLSSMQQSVMNLIESGRLRGNELSAIYAILDSVSTITARAGRTVYFLDNLNEERKAMESVLLKAYLEKISVMLAAEKNIKMRIECPADATALLSEKALTFAFKEWLSELQTQTEIRSLCIKINPYKTRIHFELILETAREPDAGRLRQGLTGVLVDQILESHGTRITLETTGTELRISFELLATIALERSYREKHIRFLIACGLRGQASRELFRFRRKLALPS